MDNDREDGEETNHKTKTKVKWTDETYKWTSHAVYGNWLIFLMISKIKWAYFWRNWLIFVFWLFYAFLLCDKSGKTCECEYDYVEEKKTDICTIWSKNKWVD